MSIETMIRESAARRAAEAPERRLDWSDVRTAIGRDAARRPVRIATRATAVAAAVALVAVVGPTIARMGRSGPYRPPAFAGQLPEAAATAVTGSLDGVEYRLMVESSRIINLGGPDTIDHRCVKMRVEYPGAPDPFWTTGNIVVGSSQDCAVLEGRSAIGALQYRPFPHRDEMPYHAVGVVAPKVVRLTLVVESGAAIDVPTHQVAGYPLRAWIVDIETETKITRMIGHLDDGTTIELPVTCSGNGWPTCTNGVDPSRSR